MPQIYLFAAIACGLLGEKFVMEKKLISIVIPVYNEEMNVGAAHKRISEVVAGESENYDFEFVFTDNHSEDGTFSVLQKIAENDPRVRVFRFSRNFGFQRSIFTGYSKTRGAAAIQIDCDLQDPPEVITKFIRHWEEGYKVVFGIRRNRKEGFVITKLRKLFYRLIDLLSDERLPLDAGDFRLIDRCIIDSLMKIDDESPYLRGAIATFGFRQIGVTYDRVARHYGSSKFSLKSYVKLATDGIINHSIIPLRFATYFGLLVTIITLMMLPVYTVGRFVLNLDWPVGFATTTGLLLISISLNALFLGIIGEYLARIYRQVKRYPFVIIEQSIDKSDQVNRIDALD